MMSSSIIATTFNNTPFTVLQHPGSSPSYLWYFQDWQANLNTTVMAITHMYTEPAAYNIFMTAANLISNYNTTVIKSYFDMFIILRK